MKPDRDVKKVTVTLAPNIVEFIEKLAKENGLSKSAVVSLAVKKMAEGEFAENK